MLDLATLTPGDTVLTTLSRDHYVYAGAVDGRAVLVDVLGADLSRGYSGHPAVTGHLTATATGLTYAASVVHPRHLRPA
jgi:hypothetical protein